MQPREAGKPGNLPMRRPTSPQESPKKKGISAGYRVDFQNLYLFVTRYRPLGVGWDLVPEEIGVTSTIFPFRHKKAVCSERLIVMRKA